MSMTFVESVAHAVALSNNLLLKPFAGWRGRTAKSDKNMSMTLVESIAHAVALSNNFLPEPNVGLMGR